MIELNEKIAEWVLQSKPDGFTFFRDEFNFTTSLDALFKYVVPELDQSRYYACLKSIFYYEAVKGKEALAFCKAVEKLIDGEKD